MKKKYCKPEINSLSLDKDIVMFMVSDPNHHHHHHGHGHNVQGDNVRDKAFGGHSPFPDEPQY